MKNAVKWHMAAAAWAAALILSAFSAAAADGYADTDLFLRSAPSAESEKLAVVHQGETVTVTGPADGSWLAVSFPRGEEVLEGYVNGNYLVSADGTDLFQEAAAMEKSKQEPETETSTQEQTEELTEAPAQEQTEQLTEPETEELTEPETEELTEPETEELTEPETEELTEPETEELTEPESEELTEPETEELTEEQTEQPMSDWDLDHFLWVGDSRTVGMALAVDGDAYLAEESAGIWWLRDTAIPQIEAALAENKDLTLVFTLGINDLSNIVHYIETYQDIISTFPGVHMILLSVLPVNESIEDFYGYTVTNEEISAFNQVLEENFPEEYLDGFSLLEEFGFITADGVHFGEVTYYMINLFVHEAVIQKHLDLIDARDDNTPKLKQ